MLSGESRKIEHQAVGLLFYITIHFLFPPPPPPPPPSPPPPPPPLIIMHAKTIFRKHIICSPVCDFVIFKVTDRGSFYILL